MEGSNLAAVLTRHNRDLELLEVSDPVLLDGQVRVKILKTAICGTQIGEWSGTRGIDRYLPHCLGHEALGQVIEVSSSVGSLSIGDYVIVSWIKSIDLMSSSAPVYRCIKSGRVINSGECATFIRRGVFPENRITKISGNNIQDYFPLLGCALLTACGVIRNIYREQILFGEEGVVVGLGGIGLSVALILKKLGYKIIGLDTAENIKRYQKIGIPIEMEVFNEKKLSNKKFSVIAAGSVEAIETGIAMLSPLFGVAFIIGNPPAGDFVKVNTKELLYGKKIVGIGEKDIDSARDIERLIYFLDDKPDITKYLIRNSYKFESINMAMIDAFENGGARVLVDMN